MMWKVTFDTAPDNGSGIKQLSVHHVIALITTTNKKYEDGADNEHDDEAFLPHFIGKRIFRNPDNGGKRSLRFHVNLSQALQTHLPVYHRP